MRVSAPCAAAFAVLASPFAAPAAAHDTPLALVEGLQDHLLDCPAANGYQPGADMLSDGWSVREGNDPVLARKAAEFADPDSSDKSNVNIFTKQVQGLELIQFMGLRTVSGDEAGAGGEGFGENLDAPDPIDAGARSDTQAADQSAGQSATFLCVTMIPDLPFMPTGKLLSAVFGKEVDVGAENTPGNSRDGVWIWDDLSPTHLRTIARFTNAHTGQTDLPDDVFYPGFYLLSLRKFTAEYPDPETGPYPVEDVLALVQNTCFALPDPAEALEHFYSLGWYGIGKSSHPGAHGSRAWQKNQAKGYDADAPDFVTVMQQDVAGETLYAVITLAQKDGARVQSCSIVDYDEARTLDVSDIGTFLGAPVPEATEVHGQTALQIDLDNAGERGQSSADRLTIKYFRPTENNPLSGIQFHTSYKEGDAP